MKIRSKLVLILLPLGGAGIAAMTALSRRAVSAALVADVSMRTTALAETFSKRPLLARAIEADDEKRLLPLLQELVGAGASYAAALDRNGRVVAHTNVTERGKKLQALPPPSGRRVKRNGYPVLEVAAEVNALPPAGPEDIYAVSQLRPRIGSLLVAVPLEQSLRTAASLQGRISLVVTGTVTAMILAAILFLNWTLRPIQDMVRGTQRLAAGGLGETVPVRSSDELGQLAQSFNRMSRELSQITVSKEELAAKARELERSNAELEQFAYVASHDLQEPLRKITSYIQLLQRRYHGKLDPNADQFIAYVVDGALRMRALIQDLLAFSRAGRGERGPEPIDLRGVVGKVLEDLETSRNEANARIEIGDLPTVIGDRGRLEQLFENLIGNALKFRPPKKSPTIKIGAASEPDRWRIWVEDNGIGVPPEYRERIFVIFQRLHPRKEYGGTGIGLAICKRIVESLGGHIWVEQPDGPGARFVFTLLKGGSTP